MSGDKDKSTQRDPSATGAPDGVTFSSYMKDKAPTVSRILQEAEERTAALAAASGDGDDDLDLELVDADETGAEQDDPFVTAEEESFDISFDDPEENDGEETPASILSSDDDPAADMTETFLAQQTVSEDDEEEDLGPPLPDLSAPASEDFPSGPEADETDNVDETAFDEFEALEQSSVEHSDQDENGDGEELPDIEFADDEDGSSIENLATETPENAEPLDLAELDEGLDITFDDAPAPAPQEPETSEPPARDDDGFDSPYTIETGADPETAEMVLPDADLPDVDLPAADLPEAEMPDIEMSDFDDEASAETEHEEDGLPEPADEFADWGTDDDGDEDLGPPLPDLSGPAQDDSGAQEELNVEPAEEPDSAEVPLPDAADEDAWPDAQDFPEPASEIEDGDADTIDETLDESLAESDETDDELTLEIEGLDFQPGAPIDGDEPTEDGRAEADELAPDAPEPEVESEVEPDTDVEMAAPSDDGSEPPTTDGPSIPAPGVAEPAKPVTVQEALMAAIELHRIGDLAGAARGYEGLVRRFPNSSAGWINLGIVLRRLGKLDAALVALRRGVMLNPKDGAAWSNLGNALRAANYLEGAKRAQIKAISLSPGAAQIHYNMGLVNRDFGELVEADACFRRADLLGYTNPDLAWDQSLTLLLSGNLEEGFEAYEARWNLPETLQRYADLPRWNGAAEPDKTIVVHAEQGLGDSLQFCRYVPALKSRVGRLIFEVQPPLVDLLKASPRFQGVEIHAREQAHVDADMQIPLLSAPKLLPLGEFVLPGREPYLSPPPNGPRTGDGGSTPRIGIAWAGKPTHKNDANRTTGLSAFTALFDVLNARFYSLQIGPAQAQIGDLSLGAVIQDLSPAIRNFADTASLLQDLDLVVTVDTSVAHLAGAMGKPVWVMLPFAPDWRWQLQRQDSPWYPSMRLFRQTRPGDWDEVFMRVRAALDDWLQSPDRAGRD
ncbi:hypothetical protein [Hwanghaeella sp.]|uniref:hypothetical protein n=1 Tax=Hwanghaeella sp. TaxID=2605943 RepID=UPI003CCC4609